MKARFVGDPNDSGSGPDRLTMWGVEFVKGEWTAVSDRRLATHSHFEFRDEDEVASAPVKRKRGGGA